MSVTLYGVGDDNIEIEGDVSEEFVYIEGKDNLIAFSNGTVLRIFYGHGGIWRINPVVHAAPYTVDITLCPEDDEEKYSDVAVVKADIAWVGHCIGLARTA